MVRFSSKISSPESSNSMAEVVCMATIGSNIHSRHKLSLRSKRLSLDACPKKMSTAIKTKFLVSHLLVNSIEQILVNSTQLSYSWETRPAEPGETLIQHGSTWSNSLVLFELLFTSNFVGPLQNFILRTLLPLKIWQPWSYHVVAMRLIRVVPPKLTFKSSWSKFDLEKSERFNVSAIPCVDVDLLGIGIFQIVVAVGKSSEGVVSKLTR